MRWKQNSVLHQVHCASDRHINSFLTTWGREVIVTHGFQKEIKTPVSPESYWESDLNLLLQTEGEVNGALWTPSFIDSPTLFTLGRLVMLLKPIFLHTVKGDAFVWLAVLAWCSQHHQLMWLSMLLLPCLGTENAPFHSCFTWSLLTSPIKTPPRNPMLLLVLDQAIVH